MKTNVFLQDMNDFAAMNEVYSESIKHFICMTKIHIHYQLLFIIVFTDRHPARSTVQVAGLPKVNNNDFNHLIIIIFFF